MRKKTMNPTKTTELKDGQTQVSSLKFTMSYKPEWDYSYNYMDLVADGAPATNKYSITSSGNGHVEVQG